MRISSSAFQDKGTIPAKYTCDGNNIIPPISISDVPEGTKTLTLIMDEPDVPKSFRPDVIFDHWLVGNIPADVKEIREGEAPAGIEGKNKRGEKKYTGPGPADREPKEFFK